MCACVRACVRVWRRFGGVWAGVWAGVGVGVCLVSGWRGGVEKLKMAIKGYVDATKFEVLKNVGVYASVCTCGRIHMHVCVCARMFVDICVYVPF